MYRERERESESEREIGQDFYRVEVGQREQLLSLDTIIYYNICVYIYIYMYMYMYMYVCMFIYTYIYIYIEREIYVYIYIYTTIIYYVCIIIIAILHDTSPPPTNTRVEVGGELDTDLGLVTATLLAVDRLLAANRRSERRRWGRH